MPEACLERSSSDEDAISFALRESRADFPEVSVQFQDPSEWKLTAFGGFFREENVVVLEARSILFAVRYAENSYPPRRLLMISDSISLMLALSKGRSIFSLLSVMRRIFASGFRAGFVSSFRWIPSKLKCSEKGGRFFYREYDPSQSRLHGLALRLTRSSPTQTCDRNLVKLTLHLTSMCPQ